MALSIADLPRKCVLKKHINRLPPKPNGAKTIMIALNTDYKEALKEILEKIGRSDILVLTEYEAKYSGHGGFLNSDVPSL